MEKYNFKARGVARSLPRHLTDTTSPQVVVPGSEPYCIVILEKLGELPAYPRRWTMRRIALLALVVGFLTPFLVSAPAQAQATRTWVSGFGDDVNPCSRTAP